MRVKEFRTFGATMLTLVGTLNVAQGLLVAFASGRVGFDRAAVSYTSAGTWAAATVTLGALLAVVGLALHARKPSAKPGAVSIVALHAISQLAMLRAYPAWSLLMVTLDVIILFLLTVPRGSVVDPATAVPVAAATPVGRLALRRNGRADTYRPRHKRGRPVTVAGPMSAVVVEEAIETVDAELVLDPPTIWIRAVGHAVVPELELRVPVQRSSLESIDPLIDPLPIVLAGEAAIAAAAVADEPTEVLTGELAEEFAGELAAIGARPYVQVNG